MSFDSQLAYGKVAESYIAKWLIYRGNAVMPAYQIEKDAGKGPQLFTGKGGFVAPDIVAFTSRGVIWIEAKHKTVWSWHRNTQRWTTGIDLRHYEDYQRVARHTNLPVWLVFYHSTDKPAQRDVERGCPTKCPVGLFGGEIFKLTKTENHRAPGLNIARDGNIGHGRSGMVYWSFNSLKLLATKDEVMEAAA